MLNVALIGTGRIAWQLEHDPLRYKPCTHLGALLYWKKRHKQLRLSAFCDAHRERAGHAAAFASARDALITHDARAVIAKAPDLLVIAATTQAHTELLLSALKAGIPRVVLEKPVAFSAAEAQSLRRALTRSRSVVLPNYERRYHPKYIGLKRMLAAEPRAGTYRALFTAGGKSLYADQRRGNEGVLLHDTTHLVDLAQFLYGPVKKFAAGGGARYHTLYLEHERGASGVIETVLGSGAFHLELEMHLAKERLVVGNGFLERQAIVKSPHYKSFRAYAAGKRTADKPLTAKQNPFVALYREAIFGKPTNAHFLDALDNVKILATRF